MWVHIWYYVIEIILICLNIDNILIILTNIIWYNILLILLLLTVLQKEDMKKNREKILKIYKNNNKLKIIIL